MIYSSWQPVFPDPELKFWPQSFVRFTETLLHISRPGRKQNESGGAPPRCFSPWIYPLGKFEISLKRLYKEKEKKNVPLLLEDAILL